MDLDPSISEVRRELENAQNVGSASDGWTKFRQAPTASEVEIRSKSTSATTRSIIRGTAIKHRIPDTTIAVADGGCSSFRRTLKHCDWKAVLETIYNGATATPGDAHHNAAKLCFRKLGSGPYSPGDCVASYEKMLLNGSRARKAQASEAGERDEVGKVFPGPGDGKYRCSVEKGARTERAV